MDFKFSVIMPVYNSEKTVEKAIKSILNDNNDNVELVIINDGSTDKSEEIIKKYISDNRVSYYYQDNAGVSTARNYGLSVAKGEYIAFLDSDDFFAENAFVKLTEYADKYDSDMIGFGFYSEQFSSDYKHKSTNTNSISVFMNLKSEDAEECLMYIFKSSKVMFQTSCCKVYNKSIIKKNKLAFDTKLVCFEDMKFVLDFIAHCDTVTFVPNVLYHYCWFGTGGSSLKKRRGKELVSNVSSCFASFLNLVNKYDYSDEYKSYMYEQFFADFTYCSQKVFLPENKMSKCERIKLFSDFLNDEMFLFLKDNYFGELRFYRILYFLHNKKLDCLAYHLYKKKIVKI